MQEHKKGLNLYKLVRRPPCWNSTASLDTLVSTRSIGSTKWNVSSRVEPSGIWA